MLDLFKKVIKIFFRLLLGLLGLVLLLWLLLQLQPVQNFLVSKVAKRLSSDLHTEVSIKKVSFSFFDKMDLEGTLVRDLGKDTLLYAGTLKLRITDWFFLKDTIQLTYIGLEDAVIKMHRSDSVWNYQFIADYFSSSAPKDTTKKKGIILDIKKVDLKKVSFVQNDEWKGQQMTIKAGSLLLDADKIDFAKSEFYINTIDLDRPYFSLEDFDGRRPAIVDTASGADTTLYFNAGGIKLSVNKLNITNGYFGSLKRGDIPENGLFDGANIQVRKLNGTLTGFSFIEDTMRADISLSAVERSGLELKKLKADFKLTPQLMEFSKLLLQTNNSTLSDYYAMHFKDFNEDMQDFVEKVTIEARIKNSQVHSDDITFFAPTLKTWNKKFDLSGKMLGTVSKFKIDDLFLRNGPVTYISGNLAMKGLPDIDNTWIDFGNGFIQTNSKEIAFIYPDIAKITNPDLLALGNIRYKGNFSGTINNFNIDGTLSSVLGGLTTKLNLQLPANGLPAYDGEVTTTQFDLGKFMDVPSIGKVSFNGKINGKGFELNNAFSSLDGVFNLLEFNGYTYNNLHFTGSIQKQKFNGDFKANDPNFDFTSFIEIDLSGDQPKFNILGDLQKANFKELNFTKDKVSLTGLFDLNFTGRNIDDFLGTAKILNATLLHDSTKLDFDSLSVTSYYNDTLKKVLTINSNQFNFMVAGKYRILDLPNSFQLFLSRYYPAYINPPKNTPKNQQFFLRFSTSDFSTYASVIDQRLSGFDDVRITGGVDTEKKDSGFFVVANIPDARFERYTLSNAEIIGVGSYDSLHLTGNLGRMQVSDSMFFPNSTLTIVSSNDHSIVSILTSANETLNEASLNADVYTMNDGVRINFRPSSFVLNGNKWELEKQGEIVISKNFASADNVKFKQGLQEIQVESEDNEFGNTSNLVVKLKDVNFGDFTPLFMTKPRLEGLVNGNVYLRDFYNKFKAETSLKAEQFRLDNDSIGLVNVNATYNSETGKVDFNVKSDNDKYTFSADGYYQAKDSTSVPLNTTVRLKDTKIGLVNQFLTGIFSNIDGLATGDITISGKPNAPDLIGKVHLTDGAITVDFTKVRYKIPSADFEFKKDGIDFGKFVIKDEYNNTGSVRGILYEKGFDKMSFDFDMSTNNLLLINTTGKDNQQFYGKAIGKASLSLKGPMEDMKMYIKGEVTDTSNIYIATSTSKESADADFIVFKKYGIDPDDNDKEKSKLSIDLDLTANNLANIDVILDELTGDVIKATGNGRLFINIPASGDMTMKGRYNIESGTYRFNFQDFLRKPFILRPNAGSYIEWTGDPYRAEMKVEAQYTAQNVSFYDLISNTGFQFTGSVAGYRNDVYVVAILSGILTNPDIKFRFDFPPNSSITNDREFQVFLNKVQSEDNEMLKQITWLIVFGSFAPYGDIGSGGNAVRSAGINTLSQKIAGELNKLISSLLTTITGDKSLRFDLNASTYSSSELYGTQTNGSSTRLDRQVVNLKLNKSLLNGKLILTFGTGIDFRLGNSAVQTSNLQWLPDISAEIVLSKDGKLRTIIFNKSSLDVLGASIGRRTRQGISLSYSIDFPADKKNIIALPVPEQAADTTTTQAITP